MDHELLTTAMLADFLHTSTSYIRNQISMGREGITIPPSIKLGRKRVWVKCTIDNWLNEQSSKSEKRIEKLIQHKASNTSPKRIKRFG